MITGEQYSAIVRARAEAVGPDLRRMVEVERINAEDIGPRLGLASATVHKYCRLLGIPLVRKNHPARNYAKADWLPTVRRLLAAGKDWAEIGAALGTTRITANRFGLQHGLTRRKTRDQW